MLSERGALSAFTPIFFLVLFSLEKNALTYSGPDEWFTFFSTAFRIRFFSAGILLAATFPPSLFLDNPLANLSFASFFFKHPSPSEQRSLWR